MHGCLDPQEKGELCSVLCKRELNSKERKGLGRIPLPAVTAACKLQALIYVLPQSTAITGYAIALEKLSAKGQFIVGVSTNSKFVTDNSFSDYIRPLFLFL